MGGDDLDAIPSSNSSTDRFMTFSAAVFVKMGLVKFVGAARIRSVDHRVTGLMC